MTSLFRAAGATALVGFAAALALPALGVVAATPGHLVAVYWPVVLIAAGLGGLPRGLGWAMYGRWVPIGLVVVGAALLAAHRAHVPLGTLAAAALLAWAGLAVAFGGGRRRDPTRRP